MTSIKKLPKPFLDPIFDVDPIFEVHFGSKCRLHGVLMQSSHNYPATPVVGVPQLGQEQARSGVKRQASSAETAHTLLTP